MNKFKSDHNWRDAKRWQKWKIIALAAIIVTGVGLASSTIALEGDNYAEPLGAGYENVIVPKHRAIISYMDTDYGLKTYRGQSADLESDLSTYYNLNNIISTKTHLGVSGTEESCVFSQAQASGIVPQSRTLTNTDGFMGQTEFKKVPTGMVCTSYLTKLDADGDNTEFWLEMTGRSEDDGETKRIGRVKVKGINRPYSQGAVVAFNGGSYDLKTTPFDRSIAHDMVAFDWNNDGYTDYLINYLTDPNGATRSQNIKIALLFVDGKSLYETCIGSGSLKTWTMPLIEFITTDNIVDGFDQRVPPNSVRTAIGDMDGDGNPEITLYYTKIEKTRDYTCNNHLKVFNLAYNGLDQPTLTDIYSKSKDVGRWYSSYDSVAVAMGDLNGDGFDELAVLHGKTSKKNKPSTLYLDVYKMVNGEMSKLVTAEDVGETTKRIGKAEPVVEASIADLDGDGIGELVHIHTLSEDDTRLHINIHKWPVTNNRADLTGSSNRQGYWLHNMDSNWVMDSDYARFSMDTGMFAYPDTDKIRKQIGLVSTVGGTSGKNGIKWGIFTWDASKGLELIAKGSRSDGQSKSLVVPLITAADIDDDSMVLGEPTGFTVYDNIEPVFIIQAPPRHWDVITTDGKKQTMDAFSVLNGYSTSVNAKTSDSSGTVTTETSKGSFGVANGFTLMKTFPLHEPAKILDYGLKNVSETAAKNTESETVTVTRSLTATAQYDDQIYYRANTHEVYRYPVLFPLSQAFINDEETGTPYRKFIQIIVPKDIKGTFAPTSGKEVDWYEPKHNGLNLFSYPKKLTQIRDFPQGASGKLPDDYWKDRNGLVLAESLGQTMGNVDSAASSFTIELKTHVDDLESTKNTISGYGNCNLPAVGILNTKLVLSTNLSGDNSYSTDSITTADHSKIGGITVSWPGVSGYVSPSGMTPGDQQFKADTAIYTSDNGVFSVGYSVSNLYKKYSAIWGDTSPYSQTADPALNLPRQWVINGGKWQSNPFAGDANRIRGLVFDEASIVNSGGVSGQAFPINTQLHATMRVYNYSFVATDKVTVTFSFQPMLTNRDDPDITKSDTIGSTTISSISGRDSGISNNWVDLDIAFKTHSEQKVGYLHIKLTTDGGNLQTNNDRGHLLVGVYDPDKQSIKPVRSSKRLELEKGDRSLTIVKDSMSVRPLNTDGSFGNETTTLAPGKTAIVQATIRFTHEKGVQKRVLLNSSIFLRNATGFVGQKAIPMLENGEDYLVQMLYTAPDTAQTIPLRLILSSPVLSAADDTNPEGRTATKILNAESSSGCSVGFTPAAILLVLSMALFYRKRR